MIESHYSKLEVWKLSIELSKEIYTITSTFPKVEQYGLTDQMRRASVSIASNIAEGAYRGSIQDNIRFLYIAKGSCGELETQLVIAQEIGFLDIQDSEKLLAKTQIILKLLSGLVSKKRLSNLPQ